MTRTRPAKASSGQQAAQGVQTVTRKTLLLNLLLSAVKLIVGLVGNSQALVADGMHSLSDCASDIGILVGVRFWSAPADEEHPFGHWRIEALVTIAMGLSLTGIAIALVLRAWHTVQGGTQTPPSWFTLLAALLTIALKEWMYRWTIRQAEHHHSSALAANAWHQRSDALSSIPAAAAITGAIAYPEVAFLDPLGALVVSGFVLYAALRILQKACADIMDESLPRAQRKEIADVVLATEGVTGTHEIRTRRVGPGFYLDLHVLVPGHLTVQHGHDIAETVRTALLARTFRLLDVVVHIEPDEEQLSPPTADVPASRP